METTRRWRFRDSFLARKGSRALLALGLSACLGLGLVWFSASPGRARQAAGAFDEVFVAPNPIPAGSSELWIGSSKRLPEAAEVLSLSEGLSIERAERVSPFALRVLFASPLTSGGLALRLRAGEEEIDLVLSVGLERDSIALAANIPEEDLVAGAVTTRRDVFLYGFVPREGVELASLKILNATTGIWSSRDTEALPEKDPQDPTLLVDSDGDGLVDRDDPDLVSADEPPQDFLGVKLVRGANELRIATFDKAGGSRVEHITVFYVP